MGGIDESEHHGQTSGQGIGRGGCRHRLIAMLIVLCGGATKVSKDTALSVVEYIVLMPYL